MKINYQKRWGKDGTCYTQTIKINKQEMEFYNNLLMNLQIEIDKKFLKTRTYTNEDLNIKTLEYLDKGTNYTNLTHLNIFLTMLNELNKNGKNIDFKRILWRNTIIEVVE